jgi:two-component system competent response regulator ComA
MIRILLVNDQPALAEGMRTMLESADDVEVAIAASANDALEILHARSIDVLLFDFQLPGLQGSDLLYSAVRLAPDAVVLIYAGDEAESHFNALVEAGISGMIPKTASKEQMIAIVRYALQGYSMIPVKLLRDLRKVRNGGYFTLGNYHHISVSETEHSIIKSFALGKSNKEIADEMMTSQRTLEYAITQIYRKLNVKSRKEAVSQAKHLGILTNHDFI